MQSSHDPEHDVVCPYAEELMADARRAVESGDADRIAKEQIIVDNAASSTDISFSERHAIMRVLKGGRTEEGLRAEARIA